MKTIIKQITEIQTLSLAELRERWGSLFGTEAPGYSREHLIRRICYRIQELVHGGLSEALRDHLGAGALEGTRGQAARLERRGRKDGMPVVGTRLVREWHGERHEVTVVGGGFEYQGRIYRSLTAVAKAITHQHWSGVLFFGLRTRPGKKR